ncbi:MAG: helix-turn-helix domain-containing protein [Candidatus Thermoplasmatota archaeon]|jgi:putative transcriptional regulator|nr:helix-turn-helix domain-containing protein [Candidatus Thermoplasmatota archaeon]MCL5787156.1 helix-turn-helix domain-containing protein [Candidatus Thermoplasmatota archaeon]
MNLEEKVAGEITISENPGETMRKWREEFQVAKVDLSRAMDISPSMISDYESGRRKSPGIATIKKFVYALTEIDKARGGIILRRYNSGVPYEALIDISDYDHDVHLSRMIKAIDGVVHSKKGIDRYVHGYTVVDGIKAILSFSYSEYSLLYGWSSQRAIFFTDVKLGRSPMIAIRVHPLKPAAVVYIQADRVDELAVKIAEIENIPLITTEMPVKDVCRAISGLR